MTSSKRSSRSFLDLFHSSPTRKSSTSRSSTPESTPSTDALKPVRRPPLAPLDQQAFNPPAEHMSPSSASPSIANFNQDVTGGPARYIGKSVIARRPSYASEEAFHSGGSPQTSAHRRKSQSRLASPSRPLPYPQSKPTRRPLHTHTQSTAPAISSRRTSLPALHLQTPTTRAITLALTSSPPIMQENAENVNTDDFYAYSSLDTYTFGAATTPAHLEAADVPSPLTVWPHPPDGSRFLGTASTDHTPRPSIAHPREEDDEEPQRRNRAKMRAIDDGGRRPSLPTNLYSSTTATSSENVAGPSRRGRAPTMSDVEGDLDFAAGSDGETDTGHESGIIDTDVEYEPVIPDNVSQHTFGTNDLNTRRSLLPWDLSDSEAESDGELDTAARPWESYIDIVDPADRGTSGDSPVTFARALPSDEDSASSTSERRRMSVSVLAGGRRGSLPVAIPGRTPTSVSRGFDMDDTDLMMRDREGSIATLRRPSRSVDDDLGAMNLHAGLMPASEPTTHGDWGAQSPDDVPPAEDVYEGLNMDYIMSAMGSPGSRRSSNSFMQPLPLPPSKGKGKGKDKDKGKGKDKGKDKGKGKDKQWELDWEGLPFSAGARSPGSSHPEPSAALLDVAPWATSEDTSGRRPSQVTLSGDDTFTGQLKKFDADYAMRRREWSFKKIRSVPPRPSKGPGPTTTRSHDVWRCPQIGQLRLDRTTVITSDPMKPPQQRLNVYHIPDPTSVNPFGGPASILHKHSKAIAFSIFRSYELLERRLPGSIHGHRGQGTHSTMPTSNSFLLATKKVQEHYTNTKSTKMLSTHGLLEDDRQDSRRGQSREDYVPRRTLPPRPPLPFNPARQPGGPEPSRRILDPSQIAEIDQASSAEHSNAQSPSLNPSLDLVRTPGSFTTHNSDTTASQATISTHDSNPPSSSESSVPATPRTSHEPPSSQEDVQEDAQDPDSDSEVASRVRTSHAEAFATLDPVALEQYRTRHPTSLDSQPSAVTNWFRRRMRPTASRSPQTNFNPIHPPWLTLAPRNQQEEQDRVIQALSSSFKDVGLMPSFGRNRSAGIGRTGRSKNGDVLTHVPDDSLYMLLPLWPRETDAMSALHDVEEHQLPPPVEQRLYLLVYYVPFEERGTSRAGTFGEASSSKKRSRSTPRKGERAPDRSVFMNTFRVIARLVAHSDLRGSGVRLPSRGLAVMGPMADAVRGIPPAALRDVHQDDFVIGVCLNRDAGVEFIPEGLDKLGLCEPRRDVAGAEPLSHPGMQVREIADEEVEPQPLTAIGRAAVEMAWLGCMAVTTFRGY